MIAEEIPEWLSKQCKNTASLGVFQEKDPNHILINEYLPNQGIMPHVDGPMYYPTVSTISLGSHTLLDFYRPITDTTEQAEESTRYLFSVLVEPKSLLILQDEMYNVYLHGIRELSEDLINDKSLIVNYEHLKEQNFVDCLKRQTRVSLTIRHVPKILKLNVSSLFSKKKI